jgi:site-specific DNA-methyltransferase (adenine-specific)/modification methylase
MKVEIGNATLYLGDCMDILPTLPKVDAVITDPPYGLGELSGISKKRNRNAYAGFDDTEQNVIDNVIPAIKRSLELAGGRGLITPGCRCLQLYPRARAIGGFYQPAAVGMSPWGFVGFNPVLFYGKDPRGGKGQSSVATTLTEKASTDEHPCAKPLGAMLWMVKKGGFVGETILDPFMGSGTTGVAAIQLGRKFIGIEREPKYFDVACKRIEQAVAQGRLFEPEQTKQVQEQLI